jgi:[acyl-carrier-protein] S-malonyltransferase
VEQVVSPVRWSSSVSHLARDHRVFVEAGPGKVLTGLLRDIDREAKCFGVQDADTLAKFLAFRSEPPAA